MRRFIYFLLIMISLVVVFFLSIGIKSFKGEVEKIQFASNIDLSGVLIKPKKPGPYPVVLLLHGSGSNHQPYDKLYFKHHANAFIKEGFAVFVYSKRSSKDVDYRYFTYTDLLNDAQAAVDVLKSRKDIQGDRIGVMGVSESGWFTPELAKNNPEIKFLINRVSSSLSVRKTFQHEVISDALDAGYSMSETKENILSTQNLIWDYYLGIKNERIQVDGPEREAINSKLSELHHNDRFKRWFDSDKLADYDAKLYAAIAQRLNYDPSDYIRQLKIPMLYVLAGKDKNIPTEQVVKDLSNLQQLGKAIDLKVYENASHYLYKYGLEDGPYEGWLYYDDYLSSITEWASTILEETAKEEY